MEVRKYTYLTGVQTYTDATLAIDLLSVKEFTKFLVSFCKFVVHFSHTLHSLHFIFGINLRIHSTYSLVTPM